MKTCSLGKLLNFTLTVILATVIVVHLQKMFPQRDILFAHFDTLIISDFATTLILLCFFIRATLNIKNIKENQLVERILSYFIWQGTAFYLALTGFSIGMIITSLIFGNYFFITQYFILGIVTLAYASLCICFDMKLKSKKEL